MKHLIHPTIALLFALYFAAAANAQTSTASAIVVEQPWARATPGGAKAGVAYMSMTNKGATTDRLLSAMTPMADKVQFHEETEDNGVSRMRELQSVDVKPGAKIVFHPGGMHMMLVGLKKPLAEGQTFPLTLRFEKAGDMQVTVPIEKVGAMQHDDTGSMTHGPSGAMKK